MKNFLALGAAHWDILGRADVPMQLHDDVGGRIRRMIGGVAGPIAMKLAKAGSQVELICYAGHDELGEALLSKLDEFNVGRNLALRDAHPTDVYMGIEAPNGLVAAIADCHSLEHVSAEAVLTLFEASTADTHVIVDGNMTADALAQIADADFAYQNITLVPASPGKIQRLRCFIGKKPAQIIVNLREAELLLEQTFQNSTEAAKALHSCGFSAALVSNGGEIASFAKGEIVVTEKPPEIEVKRFTGAGDTLSAHFLHAQSQNQSPADALHHALMATTEFISHEDKDA